MLRETGMGDHVSRAVGGVVSPSAPRAGRSRHRPPDLATVDVTASTMKRRSLLVNGLSSLPDLFPSASAPTAREQPRSSLTIM